MIIRQSHFFSFQFYNQYPNWFSSDGDTEDGRWPFDAFFGVVTEMKLFISFHFISVTACTSVQRHPGMIFSSNFLPITEVIQVLCTQKDTMPSHKLT